jgi:hypothetical protein
VLDEGALRDWGHGTEHRPGQGASG